MPQVVESLADYGDLITRGWIDAAATEDTTTAKPRNGLARERICGIFRRTFRQESRFLRRRITPSHADSKRRSAGLRFTCRNMITRMVMLDIEAVRG
jgi:hypothetical protein